MNEKIITNLIKRIERSDLQYQIKDYLKGENLSDKDAELYIEYAKQRIYEKRLTTLPKTKKIIFGICLFISLLTLCIYIFILPNKGFGNVTLLSILGSIIFSGALLYTWVYYNSWKENRIKKELETEKKHGKGISGIFILIPIPAIIIYFIFSSVLENGENNFLKASQVEVEGTVISGSSNNYSIRRRNVNVSTITVEFTTKEGKKVLATEDISQYEFKEFYKGQKIRLVYSASNPANIGLLTNKSNISKFKNSEERDFKATDLIELINTTDEEKTLELLNKISYGWKFNANKNLWENNLKNMLFTKNNNRITLLTDEIAMYRFPKQFLELNYNDITIGGIKNPMTQKERLLENEIYIAKIERIRNKQKIYVLTSLEKK
ncbi:hypothetical protein [Polaribacter sp. Hel1_85]|uniref:hypothetical protein n=1 Tax=Polaribacter sp. Hel1_85 TaxID=1250005 RepID=UPI00052DEDAE|nr:hypothetical protein [Polaribacter sp. Hel1_85]KGL59079.1 hypothetical protein PHEL85_3353 [Polaribacter sp. Hel1_85]